MKHDICDLIVLTASARNLSQVQWSICRQSRLTLKQGFFCAKIGRDLTEIDHLYECSHILNKTRLIFARTDSPHVLVDIIKRHTLKPGRDSDSDLRNRTRQ